MKKWALKLTVCLLTPMHSNTCEIRFSLPRWPSFYTSHFSYLCFTEKIQTSLCPWLLTWLKNSTSSCSTIDLGKVLVGLFNITKLYMLPWESRWSDGENTAGLLHEKSNFGPRPNHCVVSLCILLTITVPMTSWLKAIVGYARISDLTISAPWQQHN